MRIGIDFDNTIARYDNLFIEIASKKSNRKRHRFFVPIIKK